MLEHSILTVCSCMWACLSRLKQPPLHGTTSQWRGCNSQVNLQCMCKTHLQSYPGWFFSTAAQTVYAVLWEGVTLALRKQVTFSVVRVVESFLQKIASKVPYSHTTTDVINLLANLFPQGILQYRGSRWVAISSKPIPRFPIPSLLQWGHHVMFRRRGRNNRPRDSAAASLCN